MAPSTTGATLEMLARKENYTNQSSNDPHTPLAFSKVAIAIAVVGA